MRQPTKSASTATLHLPANTAVTSANAFGWETRVYQGLRLAYVPGEVRNALADALGELGVEAEFFLLLLRGFPGAAPLSHARGEIFLARLDAAARRLYRMAATLEVATQSFLTAMETADPDLQAVETAADPWWPDVAEATSTSASNDEPFEFRLRRCGFAYRHVVESHLATNIEAIASQMSLALHALATLPPAGVLPASTLYQGLYELSSSFQGYLIPHHITGFDQQTPGLFGSIAQLCRLDAEENTSIQSDLVWAQAQLDFMQNIVNTKTTSAGQRQYALEAVREWQRIITMLSALAQAAPASR